MPLLCGNEYYVSNRSSDIATTVDLPFNRDFGYESGEGYDDDDLRMKENGFG